MKLIFTFFIAINFLIQGCTAQAQKNLPRLAYLKNRIEQLESQPGTLKDIQAIQREIDDLENAPKLPTVVPDAENTFIDGGQSSQETAPTSLDSDHDGIDFFHDNPNLVAVDYGVPKEIVDRMKNKITSSSALTAGAPSKSLPHLTAPDDVPPIPRDEIRKKREDIHLKRGVMGKGLKIPKRARLSPPKTAQTEKPAPVKKMMHGRPDGMLQKKLVNEGPRLDAILPVSIPRLPAPKENFQSSSQPSSHSLPQSSSWGFCEKDIPYLQEKLEVNLSQLEEMQNIVKRTKDGFEVQKLANKIQQLENDKQYYIKMIKSMGGTPKLRKPQVAVAQTIVPAQSQEFQIKSDLERLNKAEKMVRHKIRITKDSRALSALGASLENIQNQKKLLVASSKDTGAMDTTKIYETPNVFHTPEKKPEPVAKEELAPATTVMPTSPVPMEEKTNWAVTAKQAVDPDYAEHIDDYDVVKSAPEKPLWAGVAESQHEKRPVKYQAKGQGVSQSEARQIAKAWLSR